MRSLGLKRATCSSTDYWATYPRTEVSIDSISQMTTLKCGELGTEVAAATICAVSMDSMLTLEFVADRPFWFAILDQACGVVIYSGIVDNVTANAHV
jgi:serine protease inhibitor